MSFAIVSLAASGLSGCGAPAEGQGGPPPAPAVSVAPAVQRSVLDNEEFSGRLEAAEYVELRPRVAGVIERRHFTDGALVTKGQLLFTIDARSFVAEVARIQAQLGAAQTRSELARTELARAQQLLLAKAVSRQELDQLDATVRTTQAEIQATGAALRSAQLNLDYASVRAPIAGRVSRANVTAGNLVNDQVVLTTIAGVATVYAYFDGSEQTFLRIKANADKAPMVRMGLANESGFPHEGRLDFIDNRLNAQTGAIRMRASFDNRRGEFTPGLAARLTVPTSNAYSAVLVPERAIGTDQTKKTVVVVGADGKPQPREVKLGEQFGAMRVIREGVKAGEMVVVEGLQRVIPGMAVTPQVLQVDELGVPIFAPPAAGGRPGEGGKSDGKKKAQAPHAAPVLALCLRSGAGGDRACATARA